MAFEVLRGYKLLRHGLLHLQYRADLDPDRLLEALEPGEMIKSSRKNDTWRAGDWAVKQSRLECGLGPLKHTFSSARYRQGWTAAHYLSRMDVTVPEPLAYGEWRCCGVILRNVMVSEYLKGCVNVETYAAVLIRKQSGKEEVRAFFDALADSLNGLTEAGAYHADLSGKNIFTGDGKTFYFIDLDSVTIGRKYTEALRIKNHIQLYDSFCDFCEESSLDRFHSRMLPEFTHLQDWMAAVRAGQVKRRRRHGRRSS